MPEQYCLSVISLVKIRRKRLAHHVPHHGQFIPTDKYEATGCSKCIYTRNISIISIKGLGGG